MTIDFNALIADAIARGQVDQPYPDDLSAKEATRLMYEFDSSLADLAQSFADRGLGAYDILTVVASFLGGSIGTTTQNLPMPYTLAMVNDMCAHLGQSLSSNLKKKD